MFLCTFIGYVFLHWIYVNVVFLGQCVWRSFDCLYRGLSVNKCGAVGPSRATGCRAFLTREFNHGHGPWIKKPNGDCNLLFFLLPFRCFVYHLLTFVDFC